jgi:outer membrane protein TolC
MLGQDVTTKLKLTSKVGTIKKLQPIETYLPKALKERSELRTLAYNRSGKLAEFELIEDYYSSTSATYKITQSELKAMDLEKQQLEQQIDQEIREAYLNVLEKEEAFRLKSLTMKDNQRQYKNLELNVTLGFVTRSALLGLDIMMAQGTNDYATACREYLAAVAALEGASSIGPAIATTMIALPIMGSESDYEEVSLSNLEIRILGHNLEIVRANEHAMIAVYKKDKADATKDKGASTQIGTEMNKKYYPLEADMNVAYTKWVAKTTKEAKITDGIKQYLTYQYLIEDITLQNAKIKRLNNEIESIKIKITLGKATTTAQTTAELTIAKEKYTLQKLMNDKERLFLDLNVLMNYDLDTPLVFEPIKLPFEVYKLEDIKSVVSHVLDTNGDLVKLGTQGSLDSINLNIYTNLNTSGAYDSEILSLKETLSDNNLDIKDQKLDIEYQVRSKYNTLLNSYDALTIKELEVANLELTLKTIQKRVDVGLDTAASAALAKENVDFAKLALNRAKLEYYIAVETFKQYID